MARFSGPGFIFGFYYLIYLHIEVFLRVITGVLVLRVGPLFSIIWGCVGAILGFNVVFNHTMAMIIKANGPVDLAVIEKLRLLYKNRQSKKEANLDDNDRFEGLSADFKKVMRYRAKSIDDVR
jgi:hypothetical protein